MGPKANFFPSFVGRTKARDKVPIENCLATGTRKAVDISGWIVSGLKGGDGSCARALTSCPTYDPLDLLDSVDYKYDYLVEKGIEPVMYFDGSRNPLKGFTNEQRERISNDAAIQLEKRIDWARLHEEGKGPPLTDGDLQKMAKLRKVAASPDEGVYALVKDHLDDRGIEYRCAPYEADGQLAHDERMGYVSGIISEDGDIIGLKGSQLITQIDYGRGLAHTVDCKEWVAEKEIAAFCGCDFIHHLHSFVPVTVETVWKEYSATPPAQRLAYLERIEATAELPESAGGGKCEGWAKRFLQTVNFYRHCPVFGLEPCPVFGLEPKEAGKEVDFQDESTYRVVLKPLFPYEGSNWGEDIGFGADPASFISPNYNDGYHMRIWTRTGRPLRRREVPTYGDNALDGVSATEPLPPFAELDFNIQPIHSLPDETLRLYLLSRGIFISTTDTRKDVEELVRNVSTAVPAVQVLPPCLRIRDEKYTGFEMIQLRQGVKPNAGAFSTDFLDHVRKLHPITEEEASRFMGQGTDNSNNVRNRALDLVKGGFYDIESISICKCASVVDSSHDLILIRCECLASQKDQHYTVYLCFEDKDGGHLMPNPYSSCHCPVGSFFCSHMIGLYIFLAIVQNNKSFTREDFVKYMPERVEHIQNLPMLVEQIAIYEQMLKTKKKKCKRAERT